MRSHLRQAFIFCTVSAIAFLIGNRYYAEGNGGMQNKENSIAEVDLEGVSRLVLETLEYDSQKYKQRSITDKALISQIIRQVKNCELIDQKLYGHAIAHNQLLSFYQNDKKLLELEFFIHKDYPKNAFFRYYFYSVEKKKRLREYIVGKELYQLLSSLIEGTPEAPVSEPKRFK